MLTTLEESITCYRGLFDNTISQLPSQLNDDEKGKIKEELSKSYNLGLQHINSIYLHGYSFGPNLSGIIEYSSNPSYTHCLIGLGRHILDFNHILESSKRIITKSGDERLIKLFQTVTNHRFRKVMLGF